MDLPKCDFAKFPWISFDFPLISFDFGDFLDYHRLSLILSQHPSKISDRKTKKSKLKIKKKMIGSKPSENYDPKVSYSNPFAASIRTAKELF